MEEEWRKSGERVEGLAHVCNRSHAAPERRRLLLLLLLLRLLLLLLLLPLPLPLRLRLRLLRGRPLLWLCWRWIWQCSRRRGCDTRRRDGTSTEGSSQRRWPVSTRNLSETSTDRCGGEWESGSPHHRQHTREPLQRSRARGATCTIHQVRGETE